MSSATVSFATELCPRDRLEALFVELSELCGQRNAIDGRIVDLIAEIDRDELWGMTGARSLPALVAWKTGLSPNNARAAAVVAQRAEQFPLCADGLREGRLSLDQVGAIATGAADGSDAHYAELAAVATVSQLRKAVSLEPRPERDPKPEVPRAFVKQEREDSTTYRITLPSEEAATFDAAIGSHHDALINDWKQHHAEPDPGDPDAAVEAGAPPIPNSVDAFMSLVEAGWDTDVAARPHGQRTMIVVHLDLAARTAALHCGPLLPDADRQYLTCDATCEVWFEREGQPIGVGRTLRTVNRRLRRALEHRDRTCVVPGCESTRGLHAHHLIHWEDGGGTELSNLVPLCPFHHRAHHHGDITIIGPAERLQVTDLHGKPMTNSSLAHPPTKAPPITPPYPGPLGERADWWWYTPYEPPPPTAN